MANQPTDLINGTASGKEQVMPMSLGNITGTAVEARKPASSLLMQGPLQFTSFLDVPVNLVFEVGRANITIRQLMELNKGSFVELRQVSVDTIDIRINDKVYAYGETIAMQQFYGIRFGELEIRAGVDDIDDEKGGK